MAVASDVDEFSASAGSVHSNVPSNLPMFLIVAAIRLV